MQELLAFLIILVIIYICLTRPRECLRNGSWASRDACLLKFVQVRVDDAGVQAIRDARLQLTIAEQAIVNSMPESKRDPVAELMFENLILLEELVRLWGYGKSASLSTITQQWLDNEGKIGTLTGSGHTGVDTHRAIVNILSKITAG